MIKKLLSIIVILLVMSGCTYRKNYIKTYKDELNILFGDFEYEYLGKEHDSGIDGLGAHRYKQWQINYTDLNGIKENVIIRNDKNFDYQIIELYKKKLEKNIANKFSEYCVFEINDWYRSCVTKRDNYTALISYDFELDDYYNDDNKIKIENYSFFDFVNIDTNKLIENNKFKIESIKYLPDDKIVLNENELQLKLNYLSNITNKLNNIIPIEKAYYRKNSYAVNYKGEEYIAINDYELYFKQ